VLLSVLDKVDDGNLLDGAWSRGGGRAGERRKERS